MPFTTVITKLENINNVKNRKKLERIVNAGYPVEFNEKANSFMVFIDDKKERFLPFSDLEFFTGNYTFNLAPVYTKMVPQPQKILTRSRKLTNVDGGYFSSEEEAKEVLFKKDTAGNIGLLFESIELTKLINIIDNKSDIAERVLEIHKLLSSGIFEKMPHEVKKLAHKNILGEDKPFYVAYSEFSLVTKEYAGKRIRYTFSPYAFSNKSLSKAKIEVIETNNVSNIFTQKEEEEKLNLLINYLATI